MENGNYSILPESQGQTRATILPSVWQKESQARHQDEKYQEVESTSENRWVQDKKEYSLQADICTGWLLELNTIGTNIIIGTQVEYITAGLSSRILTGASPNRFYHNII